MKSLRILVLLVLFVVAGSAQASIYFEDLEGHTPAAGTLDDDLGWIKYEPASVGYGPSTHLGSNVILQPAGNNIIHKPIGAAMGAADVLVIKGDMFADNLYSLTGPQAGGEAGLGVDSAGVWNTPFYVGPGSIPAEGYGGGWMVTDSLTGGPGRVMITDGGAPGVGSNFMGGVGMAVTMQITFDKIADLISVDLIDRDLGTPLIPTFVMGLTAAGEANLATITDVKICHFDIHTFGLREIDNISVTPEPATMMLLGLGGLFLRRRFA